MVIRVLTTAVPLLAAFAVVGPGAWAASPPMGDVQGPSGITGPPAKVTKGAGATASQVQRDSMGAASPVANIAHVPRHSVTGVHRHYSRASAARTMHMTGVSGQNDMGANASVGPRHGVNTGSGPGADVAPDGPGGPH